MQHSRLTGRLCFFRRPAPRGPILGSPRRAQRSGSSGGRRSKGAQRSFCRRQKRSRADFVTTKGRRFAPYKRFCRRRKPWRRANLLRPSILNNRVPIVCVGTQWEAGRRGRVSRHESFLQPEVSFQVLQQSRPLGRLCFFLSLHTAPVTGGPVCRPYGIPEPLVYSAGADPAHLWKSLVIGGRMRTSAPTAYRSPSCISSQQPACSREIPHYRREGQAPPLLYLQKVPHIL